MLRAAIVGCGKMAGLEDKSRTPPLSHAAMLKGNRAIDLTACCDPDLKRRQRFAEKWQVPGHFADWPSMLKAGPLDLLVIASPTDTHLEALRDALGAGVKVILVEKPVAWRSADLAAFLEGLGAEKNRIVVNYHRRFAPNFRALYSHLTGQQLGEVRVLSAIYPLGLVHAGTHMIDLLLWYFGRPSWLQPIQARAVNDRDVLADFALGFDNGATAVLRGVAREPANLFELDIVGTKGRVRISLGGRRMEYFEPGQDPDYQHLTALQAAPAPFETQWQGTYEALADHLLDLADGSATLPACGLGDALAALRVAEQVRDMSYRNDFTRISL